MKKIVITLAVAVAAIFAFSSCQKENFQDNGSASGVRTISAEFESKATKTTLNSDGITPEWAVGDKIRILSETFFEDITLTTDNIENDGRTITFNTSLIGTLYAVYPASATEMTSCSDGNITFTIPTEQDGTFGSANICVAKSMEDDDTKLIFRNATAVLKITTPADVVKVDVAAANPIAGTVTATFEGNDVKLDTESLNVGTVSAKFESAPSDNIFYFAVAPVTTGDAAVTCYTLEKHGSAEKDSKYLRRNVIYSMDLSTIELNEDGGACIAAGTMITMENGGQKAVEEIEVGDVIRTVNHETGNVSSAPVCFIWKTENAANAFTLSFEGGTEVTIIDEHGFYDKDERKYAFINAQNAKDYIGHHFYDADNDSWLELKGCKLSNESVDAYVIVTSGHLNHLSNGILSMSDGSFKVLANIFEYDEQMRFDADKKAADIAAYGLTPLEKILEYKGFLEADYYDYNLQYLNVAIGKGLTSWDYVKALSDYCEANGIY